MLCWQVLGKEDGDDVVTAIPIAPYAWPLKCGDYCLKAQKNKDDSDKAVEEGKRKRFVNQGFMAHDNQEYCAHQCELHAAEKVRDLEGP